MAKNYYEILGLPRNCTDVDVAKAYRKLALRFHPNKTREDKISASFLFNEVSEAYDVLSDLTRRSCYDQLGEFGLKAGKSDGTGGYKYGGNADVIFKKFFESEENLDMLFSPGEVQGSLFGKAMRGMEHEPPPKPVDLEVFINCSLEELYNGCVKNVEYQRDVLNLDNTTTTAQKTFRDVVVKKGLGNCDKIVFKGEGNMSGLYPTSDLVFVVIEMRHSKFLRCGDDLKCVHRLSLAEALVANPVLVQGLDGRKITLCFQEIISPDTVKVVQGEGMPVRGGLTEVQDAVVSKGDLIVSFNIIFPKHIPEDSKQKALELLS